MIRTFAAIAAALLLAACGAPQPVDTTAHFTKTGGKPFAVEAAANGDTRVVSGDEIYLRVGGVDHVVLRDSRGPFVAREDDLVALLTENAGPPRPQPDYVATEAGDEAVAGVAGKLWKIHPRNLESIVSVDAVVSGDPALAAVGKGLAAHLRLLIVRNSRGLGAPGNLEKAMIALADRGLVLRFGTVLRLERIDKAPIPEAHFKLPSQPLARDALKERLEAPDPISGAAML